MIPRDLHHTPSMAAYKMIRLKFELACKSSILFWNTVYNIGAVSTIRSTQCRIVKKWQTDRQTTDRRQTDIF